MTTRSVGAAIVHQVARELEEIGYLERQRDKDDRRSVRFFLTARGQRLVEDSVENIAVVEGRYASILSARGFRTFVQTLASLYDRLDLLSAQLLEQAQRIEIVRMMQQLVGAMHLQGADTHRSLLFQRSAGKFRLSELALSLLGQIEFRADRDG